MKQKFVGKGIPFLLGGYGAYRRSTPLDMVKHNNSVDHWVTYVNNKPLPMVLNHFSGIRVVP